MNYIVSFFFIVFYHTLSGQSAVENIRQDFETYYTLLTKKEYEKSMDYLVDDIFKIVDRKTLTKVMMSKIGDAQNMDISIVKPDTFYIADVQKIDQKYYAMIRYINLMHVKIKPKKPIESYEERARQIKIFKFTFSTAFGENNVNYNKVTNLLEIRVPSATCAISKDGIQGWKFINLEKDKFKIFEKFIPKIILDQYLKN